MRRLARWLFSALTVLSLLLWMGTGSLWALSYLDDRPGFHCARGRLCVFVVENADALTAAKRDYKNY